MKIAILLINILISTSLFSQEIEYYLNDSDTPIQKVDPLNVPVKKVEARFRIPQRAYSFDQIKIGFSRGLAVNFSSVELKNLVINGGGTLNINLFTQTGKNLKYWSGYININYIAEELGHVYESDLEEIKNDEFPVIPFVIGQTITGYSEEYSDGKFIRVPIYNSGVNIFGGKPFLVKLPEDWKKRVEKQLAKSKRYKRIFPFAVIGSVAAAVLIARAIEG